MHALVVFQVLLANLAYALVQQTDVPAILYSYKLSPGMINHGQEDVSQATLSLDKFSTISRQLLDNCNSDAYVFINLPGITVHDFSKYKEELLSLQRYIYSASTALSFDRVATPSNSTFSELIKHVSAQCKIDKFVQIYGEDIDDYEPYIDAAARVLRIDYPMLPEDQESRREAIIDFDKSLRTILAQTPSPAHTVILTAVGPSEAPERSLAALTGPIFPEVLLDPARKQEIEKNDHDLKAPRDFNEPRLKFAKPESRYITLFDGEFISKNYDLIRLIATSLIGFLLIQLFAYKTKAKQKSTLKAPQRQKPKLKKPEHQDRPIKKQDEGHLAHEIQEEGNVVQVDQSLLVDKTEDTLR